MQVTEDGVPVQDLVAAVKEAIKTASVSSTDADRDLRVGSVRLILHTIATRSSGGSLNFTVPFIGMEFKLGGKVTRRDTHEVEINLVPPPGDRPELRDGSLELVLVEAIETIRAAVAGAAGGDDPFILEDSRVTIAFGVTAEGNISIGVDGSLSEELTHTLVLGLVPA
jgi:Trypsin-co-occurring domain 2